MIDLANDGLKRENIINGLFNLFGNFGNFEDGGLTISINGQYGSGKSTLLNFIEQINKKENKYNIIRYDAWQNNLFENPLIPILYSINSLQDKNDKLKKGAKKIIKNFPKIIAGTLANVHGVDISSLFVSETIFDDYKKHSESLLEYQNILKEFCNKKKTIILIDELDRCLPEYQIKVLETLYNVFNIPNLILVIAIDRNQLAHSIQQIFGNKENVCGYLSKFIQYEFDLPENQNNQYLKTLISFQCKDLGIKNICAKMFDLANISIRDSKRIANELNLICKAKDKDDKK